MRYLIIGMLILLAGCQPSPPSDDEAIAYFKKHERLLNELVDIGINHPVLKPVEPALGKYTDYNGTPNETDLIAEKRVYKILSMLDADFVVYYQSLGTIEIPIYRRGLSLGGFSLMLYYDPKFDPLAQRAGLKQRFVPIEGPHWLLCESDTR